MPNDIDFMVEGQFMLTNQKQIMERLKLGASQSALTRKLSQPKFKRYQFEGAAKSPLKPSHLDLLEQEVYGMPTQIRYNSTLKTRKQRKDLRVKQKQDLVEKEAADRSGYKLKFQDDALNIYNTHRGGKPRHVLSPLASKEQIYR